MNKKPKYKIGDVIKERNRFFDYLPIGAWIDSFWTVFKIKVDEKGGHGYYLYRSDKHGNPLLLPESVHTRYLTDRDEKHTRKFGHISLEAVTVKISDQELTFARTANKTLNKILSHFDNRVQLFFKIAPISMRKKFERWEDSNYHFECAEMVADFIDHPKKYNPDLKVGKRKVVQLP